ncbi:hypothetical protein [Qipengyuania marisflavi]|uniref:Uncharacterized protein n=1 Tax=Qipengyuania marisflavi TaxID=2486356 RepID=A0A5S3PC60_9SPHN|nr:hypothetical protein [Qipengyuania marisflavi]TMM48829.1 hypothetical protein FEV51_05390 [Qipengyuania marisflavi]
MTPAEPLPLPSDTGAPMPPPIPTDATTPTDPAFTLPIDDTESEDSNWPLLAALAALAALLAAGFAFWRRRQASRPPPEIEKPVVAGATARPAAPADQTVILRAEAVKLTRSVAFATLKYRLTLINRTHAALKDVTVGADIVSAHAQSPVDQQVANSGTAIETRHTIARVSPSQSMTIEGQVQMPLAQAQIIHQGRLPLLVPLLRVRVDGAGDGALVKTFVIGQGVPGGGRLQPFRLDDAPRSYDAVAQRELA